MKKKPYWASSLTLFTMLLYCCASLSAQTLHIYYNVYNDSVRYVLDGKAIEQARMRKGGVVYVHLLEYNPYLYTATITLHNDPGQTLVGGTQALSADGASSALTGGSPLSGIFGTLSSPMFNMPLMQLGGESMSLASFAGSTRGAEEQMLLETEALIQETAQTEAALQQLSKEIKTAARSLTIATLISEQLDLIQYNPKLPPSQIKSLCTEYFSAMYGQKGLDSLSLLSSLEWAQTAQTMRQKTAEWKRLKNRWNGQMDDLQQQIVALKSMNWSDPRLVAQLNTMEETLQVSAIEGVGLDSIGQATDRLLNKATNVQAETLANLYLRYKELMSNFFTYQDYFYMSGESVGLKVELSLRDTVRSSLSEVQQEKVIKTRTFVVESYGGLKLSAGAGVNFAQFFTQPQQYSVNNDVIVAEPDDRFVPAISSQLLFYANRGERTSFGGSFGIGLPILNGDQAQAAMFFLGPSVIFGSGQRIVLTAGILGGKTNRLSKGYTVGDAFDPGLGDIPLSSRYEYGYFMGLSFNFSGN